MLRPHPMVGAKTSTRTHFEHETVAAGLAAGLVKLALESALAPLALTSPWATLQATAAIVLGAHVASPQAPFGVKEGVAGLLVHFTLAVAFAHPLVLVIRRLRRPIGVGVGIVYGLLLYYFGYYVMAFLLPWFAPLRGPLQIVVHGVYGLGVALVWYALHPPPTLEEREPEPERESGSMVV